MTPSAFTPRLLLSAALMTGLGLACSLSQAQYQWRDANGQMIISDQPPPASVKPSQIIKSAPLPKAVPAPVAKPASDGKTQTAGTPKAPVTAAEKEQAFKKRQQEKAESEKSSTEKQAEAEKKAQHCEALNTKLRTLQSGVRLTQVDKSGEARNIDAAEREKEIGQTAQALGKDCR